MPQRARTVKTIYLLLGMSPSEALREGGLNIKGIVKPFTSVERIGSKPGFVLSLRSALGGKAISAVITQSEPDIQRGICYNTLSVAKTRRFFY